MDTPPASEETIDDEFEAPPIHGKEHPSAALSDAVPTLDDEARNYHHHPNESGVVDFEVDPYAGDAAADLAGDLGSEFLEGATRGQDMSDVMMTRDDQEGEAGFLYEEEMLGGPEEEEEEKGEPEGQPERARPAERAGASEAPAPPPGSERRVKATPPIRRAGTRRR